MPSERGGDTGVNGLPSRIGSMRACSAPASLRLETSTLAGAVTTAAAARAYADETAASGRPAWKGPAVTFRLPARPRSATRRLAGAVAANALHGMHAR